MASSSASALLQRTLKELIADPVEGFLVEPDETDIFTWSVWVEGPNGSPYEGGVFKMEMKFPEDYPMSPPSLRFISDFWHPNVYTDGNVCISILHAPGDDPMSGELPQERWLPTQSVDKILLSVISLFSDPNTSSPANVDASVEWRNKRSRYLERCKKLTTKARAACPSYIRIPHPDSNPEEHQAQVAKIRAADAPTDFAEFDEFMAFDDGDEDGFGDDDDFEDDCPDDEA